MKRLPATANISLKNVIIEDIVETDSSTSDLWLVDFFVHSATKMTTKVLPNWNGLMENLTRFLSSEKSRILFLPIINNIPSNLDTVYTSLLHAKQITENSRQKLCVVTFDQPLYVKARSIVARCVHV